MSAIGETETMKSLTNISAAAATSQSKCQNQVRLRHIKYSSPIRITVVRVSIRNRLDLDHLSLITSIKMLCQSKSQ